MRKTAKGEAGYLNEKIKSEIARTFVYFLIVAAIFLLGYVKTRTRKNFLTIAAALASLPACKAFVGVIIRVPFRSISRERASQIASKTSNMTVIYDLVVTSGEKFMPIDCAAISYKTILCYTQNKKIDATYVSQFIHEILKQNRIDADTVEIFKDFIAFLVKVASLDAIAAQKKVETKEFEKRTAQVMLSNSL